MSITPQAPASAGVSADLCPVFGTAAHYAYVQERLARSTPLLLALRRPGC